MKFYGKDILYSLGIVEDIDDPLKSGRVRVRVFGVHTEDQSLLPFDKLPWSQILMPVTSASLSGIGESPTGLQKGSMVFGVFLDGDKKQQFMVLGSVPGINYITEAQVEKKPETLDISNGLEIQLIGNSNPEKAFHYFIRYGGFNEEQAAGIVGSLSYESGYDLTTTNNTIAKFNQERFNEYKTYAKENQLQENDLSSQLQFILEQLRTKFVSANNKIINSKSASDSAELFSKKYLKKSNDINGRKARANQAQAAYGSIDGDKGQFPVATVDKNSANFGDIIETREELISLLDAVKRNIDTFIIYDTNTYEDQNLTAFDIDKKHKKLGFDGSQFHFIIQKNGNLQIGRNLEKVASVTIEETDDIKASAMSDEGKAFIKRFESLALTAYTDPVGIVTIGYGHSNLAPTPPNRNNNPLISGVTKIDLATAEQYFNNDVGYFENILNQRLDGRFINQGQFDAFTSILFNRGETKFFQSQAWKLFIQGRITEAGNAITGPDMIPTNPNIIRGIRNRREGEKQMFFRTSSSTQRQTRQVNSTALNIAFVGGLKGTLASGSNKKSATYELKQYNTYDILKQVLEKRWPKNETTQEDVDSPSFDVKSYNEKIETPLSEEVKNGNTRVEGVTIGSSHLQIISTPQSFQLTDPVSDDQVTIVEGQETSTVENPNLIGTVIDLSTYVSLSLLNSRLSNYLTNINNENLNDLADVDTTGVLDGYVLTYDTAASKWVAEAPTGGGATNLTWNAASSTVASDTGTDAVLTLVDGSNPGLMSVSDKTKLDGIESGATADQSGAEIVSSINSQLGSSAWQTGGGATELDELSDVQLSTSQTLGDVLYYNGSFFVDGPLDYTYLINKPTNVSSFSNDSGYFDASSDVDHDATTNFVVNEHIDHSTVSINAGTGLTGGGNITTNRTISLSHLGIESLVDPNADRILFWDDSAGAVAWLTIGSALSISDTTLSATANVSKVGTPVNNQVGVWTGDGTIEGDSNLTWDGSVLRVSSNTVWHSANDGSGSGLDADLLDGLNAANTGASTIVSRDSSGYISNGAGFGIGTQDDISNRLNTGFWQSSSGTTAEGWPLNSSNWQYVVAITHNNAANYYSMQFASSFFTQQLFFRNTNSATTTSATAWNTVWHSGSDGAGSGLDADLLDGLQGSAYAQLSGANFTGAIDSTSTITASTYFNLDSGNGNGIRFWNGVSAYAIWMSSATDATYGGRVPGETTSDFNMYFRMTSGTNRGFVFQNSTTEVAGIDGAGNIRSIADIIAYSSSDISFKTNLERITNPIEKIKQLNGYEFEWNDKQSTFEVGMKDYGIVAQEVEKVLPHIINKRKDNSLAVKYEKIIPLLIECIKEQQEKIEQLEDKLNAFTR